MNRNTTIALVAVFGALLLYVLLVQLPRDRDAAEATATPGSAASYVWEVTTDEITGVRVVDAVNDRSVAFQKDGAGTWALTEPEARAADQAAAAAAAGRFASLFVNSTITSTTELGQFGVLSPTYTLEVSLADGRSLQAAVGNQAPTGTGYYLLREGESNVLVVSSFYVEDVVALLDQPPVPATATPAATEAAGDGTDVPPAEGTIAATATP